MEIVRRTRVFECFFSPKAYHSFTSYTKNVTLIHFWGFPPESKAWVKAKDEEEARRRVAEIINDHYEYEGLKVRISLDEIRCQRKRR